MKTALRLVFVVGLVGALAACSQVAPKAPAVAPQAVPTTQAAARTLTFAGSSSFTMSPMGTQFGVQSPEFPNLSFEPDSAGSTSGSLQAQGLTASGNFTNFINRIPQKQHGSVTAPKSGAAPGGPGSGRSNGAGTSAVSHGFGPGLTFQGLNHFDQRFADGGNQFSLEPPDQGLCAGPHFVLEAVNDVVQVYTKAGVGMGVASLNQFFYNEHAIDRATGARGHFITDPSCLYDSASKRWFLVVLTLDYTPGGSFLGTNHLDIATSQSQNPLGAWNIYSLDVTQDGNDAYGYNLGDYPHFAVNADGLFITTDSFQLTGNGDYNGAWLYGIQKSALVKGQDANVYATSLGYNTASYSVAPAINVGSSPQGVEYMVSSNTAFYYNSDAITVWEVSNTGSLDSATPDLQVASQAVSVSTYGDPTYYAVPQKTGSVPLGQTVGEAEGPVATNDSGMKQAVFVNGQLYSALTSVADNGAGPGPGGSGGAGAAWFQVTPSNGGSFSPELVHEGLVAPEGQNVIFPAITVTPGGQGVISATIVGPNDYPSAAVIPFANGQTGTPSIVMAGVGPQDGFSEYPTTFQGRPRWGDYGAAVVDPQGNIWMASEAIHQSCSFTDYTNDTTCGRTRSALANWSTQITEVLPLGTGRH